MDEAQPLDHARDRATAAGRVPDVSVVLSTFNRCDDLSRALSALVSQQGADDIAFEVIVVDNNSSDRTREVVAPYLDRPGPAVRYIFEQRQGVSYGRNTGTMAARAPIVAFTDDDNEVDARWIATVTFTLDAHPEASAIGGRIVPDWPAPIPKWLDRRHWSPLAILDYGEQPFYTSQSNPRCLLTANFAIRRAVLESLGGFSPQYERCQDHELLIRLWRSGLQALYVPGLIVRTRIAPERLTRRYHRAWHEKHGFYSAAMRLQEIIDRAGRLAAPPADAVRLRGTPGFVYRELGRETRLFVASAARMDWPLAIYHRHNMRYLGAYIRRTARTEHSKRWLPIDLMRFAARYVRKRADVAGMSATRLMVACAAISTVVGGSIHDIATDREHWPFSPYPMFSTVEREPRLERLRVVGVTREGLPREIPLLDRPLIEPFDQCRLSTAFARTYNNPARRHLTEEMLRDLLERYERRRDAGEHQGPPLSSVRLYRMQWALDPNAANVNEPDRRERLSEVPAASRHGS